jgi:hypothetical protein
MTLPPEFRLKGGSAISTETISEAVVPDYFV